MAGGGGESGGERRRSVCVCPIKEARIANLAFSARFPSRRRFAHMDTHLLYLYCLVFRRCRLSLTRRLRVVMWIQPSFCAFQD